MPVPAVGPAPNTVLLLGKAPGVEECSIGRPHVGRAGRELKFYCQLHSLPIYSFRLTNLCRDFVPPDTRLTPAQLAAWEPDILSEIERTRPRLIIALGADPIQYLLGRGASLPIVHGIPCRPGQFDPSVAYRALSCPCILPVYQPAAGFHSSDARALINWDFAQVARILKLIQQGREHEIDFRDDPYASSSPTYRDVTGGELRRILLRGGIPPLIAVDTEGTRAEPFSLQATTAPGEGYLLRVDQPDFAEGVRALQECADSGSVITGHNLGMYDLPILGDMEIDLFDASCHDTIFDPYLFGLEPLGLKANGWRQLGLRMKSHAETVGHLSRELQITYLERALGLSRDWPRPDPILKVDNAGVCTIKQPKTIASRLRKILHDIETGEDEPDDEDEAQEADTTADAEEETIEGVDPRKRWQAVRKDIPLEVRKVEAELGRMPSGSMRLLYERDPEAATNYACMDVDASIRLYPIFMDRLEREGKSELSRVYSVNMHVFSEMQQNGMPLRRSKLEALSDRMTAGMFEIVQQISLLYNEGAPINPGSRLQIAKLFDRWGLRGTKKSKKTGAESFAKKSIEHLKYTSEDMAPEERFRRELVALVFKWREHRHTRDMFCKPTLQLLEDQEGDECIARSQLIPWGTQQRRFAAKRPNILAQPKHSIYGQMLRDCYEAPEGYVFIESDLKSIEVCTMAHLSRDSALIRNLTNDPDFHTGTAAQIFNIPRSEVNPKTHRKAAKTTIFGIFLGQSPQGLKEQLWVQGLTQYDDEACASFIDAIKYRVYPGIGRYEQQVARELRYGRHGSPGRPSPDAGSVRDMWEMERHLPAIWSEDRGATAEAVRQAMSLKISGGAQGLLQNAIAFYLKDEVRELREGLGVDVKWHLTYHDSLLLTAPEWASSMVIEVVERGLTEHGGVELRVPVRAESKVARTWGGL